jgi:hypothetical protein
LFTFRRLLFQQRPPAFRSLLAAMSSVTEDNELDNDEEEDDDDTELRDLVTGVLQANGVLGKIKVTIYF